MDETHGPLSKVVLESVHDQSMDKSNGPLCELISESVRGATMHRTFHLLGCCSGITFVSYFFISPIAQAHNRESAGRRELH